MNMPPSEVPTSLKDKAAVWMFSQGTSTVLLLILCAILYFGGKYALTVMIPAHLEQIQKGYKDITVDHKEVEAANRQANREALREVLDHEREMRGLDRKADVANANDN